MANKRVLKKQARKLLRRPAVDKLGEWLDANPRGLAVLDETGALARLLGRSRVDSEVVALLLERGVDARRGEDEYSEVPLAMVVQNSELELAQRRSLCELLTRHGASFEESSGHHRYTPLDWAVSRGELEMMEFILARGVSEQTRVHALNVALQTVLNYREDAREKPVQRVQRLLDRVETVDAHDRRGLAPAHAAALYGDAQLLERVLARAQDVNIPLAQDVVLNLDDGSPPGGGAIPQLRFRKGLSPLDVAEGYRAALAAKQAEFEGHDDYGGPRRARRLARLDDALARLRGVDGVARAAAAAADADPAADSAPAFKREIDGCLLRLVAHAGGDADEYRRASDLVSLRGRGPWSYLVEVSSRARAQLLRGPIAASAETTWLGRLFTGSAARWLRETRARRGEAAGYSAKLLEASEYPDEAAEAIGADLFVGGHERAAIGLWKRSPKVARIVAVAPDRFEILGEDPIDFVKRQTALLLGEEPPTPRVYMTDPDEDAPRIRVMKADYEKTPGPGDINRVGGLPIGVDARSWPTRRGKKMHHVLTVELKNPMFRDEIKAAALFIAHPMEHEAYQPRSPETRVLLLTDRDLEKGEPDAWPEELAEDDRLEAGVITFSSGDTLSEQELYKHSYVGGGPIWLQGDDTESMYDEYEDDYGDDDYDENDEDDEDDEDDEEEDYEEDEEDDGGDDDDDDEVDAPSVFLMQFDESLVPINLGDCGIMYVFVECAWFQCH